jgi:aspartyl/glutamyl-tRNA(Asn/Gln) amidotransferase C subunit
VEVNKEVIKKLERLSMLNIDNEEAMEKKLSEILTFMENLSSNQMEDVPDILESTVYRMDEIVTQKIDSFFENNSKVINGAFEVPKVL